MKFNSTKFVLANTMMIGVIMTICSNNWVSMWMGLEVSLISFIPFMQNNSMVYAESMIKYFIIQSVASTMFLFSVIILLVGASMMNEMIMTIAMLIKIGSAPFHNWVMMIIENLSFYTMFTLLTVIKIPPLMVLYQTSTDLLNFPIMLSMIISSIMSLNQNSIRKILGYSSIYNIATMLILINKFNTLLVFLMIYSLPLIMIIKMTKTLKINFINQMALNEFNSMIKINLWINMMSMSGFPPLMGFLGKIITIQVLMENVSYLTLTVLMLSSILVMMFYMRMIFTLMISVSMSKKWTLNKTNFSYETIPLNIFLTSSFISISLIM
uniref:NADH-ubiquinone oxidoreductase chain 2 n=1 Tax=Cicadula sp. EMHAU-2015-Zz052713 TaxID=2038642 RepID=A0A343K5Y7_9HEMI|nr:NADH dehydrogenase subunit 2 [Cicadula sp. EMHAU-2015-Zz052713]